MQLGGQSASRLEIVAERLLHDDASLRREAGLGELPDDSAEQEGWDLEVEDRTVSPLDRRGDALVGVSVGEVATDVGQPGRETLEHGLVELLAGAFDRLSRALDEPLHVPVVDRDTHNRARQQAPCLESVEGSKRHHLGQVPGDSEHYEDISRARLVTVDACHNYLDLRLSLVAVPCTA